MISFKNNDCILFLKMKKDFGDIFICCFKFYGFENVWKNDSNPTYTLCQFNHWLIITILLSLLLLIKFILSFENLLILIVITIDDVYISETMYYWYKVGVSSFKIANYKLRNQVYTESVAIIIDFCIGALQSTSIRQHSMIRYCVTWKCDTKKKKN